MYSGKFRPVAILATRLIRLPELLLKNQFSILICPYFKSCKYSSGFGIPNREPLDAQRQIEIIDSSSSLAYKLHTFKTQLARCEGTSKKYDYLMGLRNHDLDLYYKFFCYNTVEVLTIIYAVDDVIRSSDILWPIGQTLVEMRQKTSSRAIEISKIVDYLRRRIQKLREEKAKSNLRSDTKNQSREKSYTFKWIKKRIEPSPNMSKVMALEPNELK